MSRTELHVVCSVWEVYFSDLVQKGISTQHSALRHEANSEGEGSNAKREELNFVLVLDSNLMGGTTISATPRKRHNAEPY